MADLWLVSDRPKGWEWESFPRRAPSPRYRLGQLGLNSSFVLYSAVEDAMNPLRVTVDWDPEARVWVAESDQVPGLATGADTLEELIEKLKVVIPELLTENGIRFDESLAFVVEAERVEHVDAAA
jgi:predicted RNase H-like HicB family nuclease